ncbi:hypothetical protein BJ875DRAFT_98805 [Amylocarpus encephaloides]|uniref:Uncharacterized protein n=1 Tax=Amylocarpus encephaloides TaxID=45428 RepID=A0A9P7YET3_9HELO|nr:hypothetical protein BJ875DRAFT_98805 [Amylocarpus encephaloides]
MLPDSSLGEGPFLFGSFVETNMHEPRQEGASSVPTQTSVSITVVHQVTVHDQVAIITPAPELRRRQNDDQACQQASRDASQAARQASQSASQSIGEAQRSASEASRQASQSASQGIQQAQQSASQSIAQASRSAQQAISSASSMVASVQSSASQALSRANASKESLQASAASAASGASKAVLQAGAAVAAATGSAAAAGSSFLAAAAAATGAQSSAAQIGAAASSSVSAAGDQVSASQSAAVTATQAALAIVGSIIASALITILIYFLITRHKKTAKRRSKAANRSLSPRAEYPADPKFPVSDQLGTTIAASQSAYNGTRNVPDERKNSESTVSLSQFPPTPTISNVKSTSVAWNPSKPPQAPPIGSWLKVQDGVSPIGSIRLPTETNTRSPLGGQLKSPLRRVSGPEPTPGPPSSQFRSSLPIRSSSRQSIAEIGQATVKQALVRQITISKPQSQRRPPAPPEALPPKARTPDVPVYNAREYARYRESKASVWIDDVPDSGPSPIIDSPPRQKGAASAVKSPYMDLPVSRAPVRTTAEWLDSIRDAADPPPAAGYSRASNIGQQRRDSRNSRFGLPRGPRIGSGMGQPRGPRPNRDEQVRSVAGELEYVEGLNRFLPEGEVRRMGSDGSGSSGSVRGRGGRGSMRGRGSGTPGVGRAM